MLHRTDGLPDSPTTIKASMSLDDQRDAENTLGNKDLEPKSPSTKYAPNALPPVPNKGTRPRINSKKGMRKSQTESCLEEAFDQNNAPNKNLTRSHSQVKRKVIPVPIYFDLAMRIN